MLCFSLCTPSQDGAWLSQHCRHGDENQIANPVTESALIEDGW
jgi:hypothetical protein